MHDVLTVSFINFQVYAIRGVAGLVDLLKTQDFETLKEPSEFRSCENEKSHRSRPSGASVVSNTIQKLHKCTYINKFVICIYVST